MGMSLFLNSLLYYRLIMSFDSHVISVFMFQLNNLHINYFINRFILL